MTDPTTDPTPTPTDIDYLMAIDPLSLTKDDLTEIIRYHRKLRAEREAGKGRAARAANAPKIKLDMQTLLASVVSPTSAGTPSIKRRV